MNRLGDNKFAVTWPGHTGPHVSYWDSMQMVLRLLARYCNSNCGEGVSAWRLVRGRWTLITDAD